MTIAARPIEELAGSQSPLAGAEQQVLREWVAEWTFDLRQFSDRAQPLVRGDIASLRRDFGNLLSHYEEQGMSAAQCVTQATAEYQDMRETRLRMPAMEVVIAGAQYYVGRKPLSSLHASHTPDHEECLQFLHDIGVAVDATDVAGFTAFMRASQTSQSRLDLAEVLLDMGADVNHRSRFGGVALHEAMMAQDRRAVSFLTRNGASMDIKDNDGISPRDIVTLIL
ncbi:hypothetical protein IWW38_000383 [Coemansia aciculifera]|uniref:Uncharacterized protein n=1 Tax=Coemansia aciculifera TaxID=417176 RepID=A0ACC1MBC6_9FUNG|nr:hypothetical protein IWW38_000383 [Coemansia aciculifera]